jgi:hypothetical protein
VDYRDLAQKVISIERLQEYGSVADADLQHTVGNYLWNIALCEAFYPLLNGVEVALRNRVHAAMTDTTGRQWWMDHSAKLLRAAEAEMASKAMNRLRRKHRNSKRPRVGQVVAELMLGFWVALFDPDYEQPYWHGDGLKRVFPYAPRSELGCHKIRSRLHRIRDLRNRVFHHEPIWSRPNLPGLHSEILETTRWLSEDWWRALQITDRFDAVYSAGSQPFVNNLSILQ